MFTRLLDKLQGIPITGAIGAVTLTAAGTAVVLVIHSEPPPSPSMSLAAEAEDSDPDPGNSLGSESSLLPDSTNVPEAGAHQHDTDSNAENSLSGPQAALQESRESSAVVTTTLPSKASAVTTTLPSTTTTHGTTTPVSSATAPPSHDHGNGDKPTVGDEPPSPNAPTTTTTSPTTTMPTTTTTIPITTTTTAAGEDSHDHEDPGAGSGDAPAPSPGGQTRLVISQDTMMHTGLVLRPGDSIEFRNGARLMFGPGGFADWRGTPTSTWSSDGRAQNLDRDVVIFGNGDIMFMQGSLPSTIKYVEIDLRPNQELGHYPLHWHLAGDSVRGTLVEGVVVKNSTNRAYVPHGSHGITIKDSIAKNTTGESFWWDEPGSNGPSADATDDLVLEHNLVDGVSDGVVTDTGNVRLAAFALRHGDNLVIRDNVVRDMAGSKDCSAYHWPERGQSEWVFENNKSFGGSCNGIFVWQNNSNLGHIIEGFASQGGQACIRHGAYVNNYQYRDVVCDKVEVLAGENDSAIAPRFQGGSINEVVMEEHRLSGVVRFVDTQVGSVHINNGKAGCGDRFQPGDYTFTNTGLSFSDITTGKVCPGTKVTIDGVTQSYGG